MRRRTILARTLLGALALSVGLAAAPPAVALPAADPGGASAESATATAAVGKAASFTFAPCNRTYQQRNAVLAPVTQGAMTIAVSSPANHLDLLAHRLDLTPLADGTHRAHFVAEYAGGGELVADVGIGGVTSRLEDTVTVPRQQTVVDGRVRLARGEHGYEITTVELPPTVDVRIESQLAGRFAVLCDSLTLLPGVVLDCDAVRAGLSHARVPMPEPGETYLLPAECLNATLRHRLDAYLGLPPATQASPATAASSAPRRAAPKVAATAPPAGGGS